MALPSSGVMKASMIRAELGESGSWSINSQSSRALAKVPSGTIKFSDFYGKSNAREWNLTLVNEHVASSTGFGVQNKVNYWGHEYVSNGESMPTYHPNRQVGNVTPNFDKNKHFSIYIRWPRRSAPTHITNTFYIRNESITGELIDISGIPSKILLTITNRGVSCLYNRTGIGTYVTSDADGESKIRSIIMEPTLDNPSRTEYIKLTEIKYYLISVYYSLFNVLREVI